MEIYVKLRQTLWVLTSIFIEHTATRSPFCIRHEINVFLKARLLVDSLATWIYGKWRRNSEKNNIDDEFSLIDDAALFIFYFLVLS